MDASDADLVSGCRRGSREAFEELYRRHARRLYNLTYRMTGGSADAEDVLQDIFITAFRKLETFNGDSSLATWLYRLGMNQCLDYLRRRDVKRARVTDSLDDPAVGRRVGGRARAEGHLTRLDLEAAIAELPEGCREVFLLHDVEGFGHQEVAAILGVAEGTSKSQVHKARMKIRESLNRRVEAAAPGTDRPES